GRLDNIDAAADGRRRAAPAGRSVRRHHRAAIEGRSGSDRAAGARAQRNARAKGAKGERTKRTKAHAAIPTAQPDCAAGRGRRRVRRRIAGSKLIICTAATLGFPLARREERCDLNDHERRATTPADKRPASLRVAAKIAAGFVETLDRIADTLFAFLLPGPRFWPQRGSRK